MLLVLLLGWHREEESYSPTFLVLNEIRFPQLTNLQAKDAIKCKQVGDLGLINGAWTVIGEVENWDR